MPQNARWPRLSVRLAVMLAFADASIAVLALPQIVDRLHTSISHAAWVIVAHNLSLIAGAAAIMPFASRLRSQTALIAGLGVFGLATLGIAEAIATDLNTASDDIRPTLIAASVTAAFAAVRDRLLRDPADPTSREQGTPIIDHVLEFLRGGLEQLRQAQSRADLTPVDPRTQPR